MRLTILPLSLLSLLSSQSILAQAVDAPPQATQGAGTMQASASVRDQKTYGLGVLFGPHPLPFTGTGIAAQYNMGPHWQFEFASKSGSWDAADELQGFLVVIEKLEAKAQTNQVRAKYYPTNSFYVAGGLGYRSISFDVALSDSSARIAQTLESESTVLTLALGNLWSFDSGFYIGGEWLHIEVPMASQYSATYTATGIPSNSIQEDVDESEELAKKLGEATTVSASFVLGWYF